MSRRTRLVLGFAAFSFSTFAAAAPITFSVGGNNTAASIQATVDSFRVALGDPNNGNAAGPLPSGRREINWDGGGSTANAPGGNPFNVFLNTRGGQFTTPGTGFVQAPASASGTGDDLGTFFGNATYDFTFGFFSPQRLFVPVGSNIIDGSFFVPGSNGAVAATVSGFGAVFTDVDLVNTTTIAYFNADDDLLFSAPVPTGTVANGSLSFLGVVFGAGERIARVRITTGNAALGPSDGGGIDVVAMDDFLYSEPRASVPEPSPLALLGLGVVWLLRARRRSA